MGTLSVTTDEALYGQELAFVQGLAETVDLDTETITSGPVLDDFSSGATLSAIIASRDVGKITNAAYNVAPVPAMNETLAVRGGSYTELLVVNEFSDKGNVAADFAAYVTTECTAFLEAQTGHI